MKKAVSLMLVLVMIFSLAIFSLFSVSAENGSISDEIFSAIKKENSSTLELKKDDVVFDYIKELTENKYLVKYSVAGISYSCDIKKVDVGNYLLVDCAPLPQLYDGGILYSLEKAYKYKLLKAQDLELMDTFEELDFSKTKTSQSLVQAMVCCDDDDYINVKFELEGSNMDIDAFDNWYDDISGAYENLMAFQESLHEKFINETLKDYDHIDVYHHGGFSVVSVRKGDIDKIAQDDFVVYMDYVSDVYAKYIKTYEPSLVGDLYKEIVYGYDENSNPTYVLIKVNTGVSAQSISFRFGRVIIRSGTVHRPFGYGFAVYDVKDDKFYDIFDVRNNIEKYDNIEEYLALYCDEYVDLVGDSDLDGKLTVLDATKIQRIVAKLDKRPNRDRYYPLRDEDCGYMTDVDNDGELTIFDATAIQKLVANL